MVESECRITSAKVRQNFWMYSAFGESRRAQSIKQKIKLLSLIRPKNTPQRLQSENITHQLVWQFSLSVRYEGIKWGAAKRRRHRVNTRDWVLSVGNICAYLNRDKRSWGCLFDQSLLLKAIFLSTAHSKDKDCRVICMRLHKSVLVFHTTNFTQRF